MTQGFALISRRETPGRSVHVRAPSRARADNANARVAAAPLGTHASESRKIVECCKADDFLMNGFIGHGGD